MPIELRCAKCNSIVKEGWTNCTDCKASLAEPGSVIEKMVEVSIGPASDSPKMYAGFWLRLVAAFLDLVILSVLTYVAMFISVFIENPEFVLRQIFVEAYLLSFNMWWRVLIFITTFLYFTVMESGGTMGTLGKMIMSLMVTDEKENPIGYPRAIARYFAKYLSSATIIGHLMIGFTKKKQGLHDMIARCLVLRK